MKTKHSSEQIDTAVSTGEEVCIPGTRSRFTEIDESAIAEAAKIHKILSDETRLKILAFLKYGELCVCDIVEALGKPQSTVSHHLFLLHTAGLIKARRKGRWNMYSLNDDTLTRYEAIFRLIP
ncbi:metalloregulator ArsR/SmtB family transcription factor [Candidatus Solincola tengchongensis]|uniref:ArsR/SmtB family transcription factor n=1 Tax=Candidatus Solincola tengchongensis TaxID=2900693 RepID=UPI0025795389|nr:metalloregulator ArsR/SmtB family transcription factor [Candidatus Solincola tengchongensis]